MSEKITEKDFPLKDFYSRIYRRYDLINHIFTFGMDRRWRAVAARLCLNEKPSSIIDLCCGTGDLAMAVMKRAGENIRVTGYDFSHEMLKIASDKRDRKSYTGLTFVQGDAAKMPFADGEFDGLTIGFGFRNLIYQNKNADLHLAEIARVLKRDSRLFILESAIPVNRIVRFFYGLYLRLILIPLGGILSGDWKAYRYLAHSSAGFYQPDELEGRMRPFGLQIIRVRKFFMGAAHLIVAKRN